MTDKITCPYCGAKMELRELGMNRNKVVFYECSGCLARSPMTNNKYTANRMAQLRKEERKVG